MLLEILKEKIVTGLMTVSLLMFGSHQVNDVKMTDPEISFESNKLTTSVYLQDAFANDFEQLFKSGKELKVYYRLELKVNDKPTLNQTFIHSVLFDPMAQMFDVFSEETSSSFTCSDVKDVIGYLSFFNCSKEFPEGFPPGAKLNVKITSFLTEITMTGDRKYDLMMFWKFKKPEAEAVFYIENDS
ncbi:MAG: hypothetical protein CSB55_05835 [Candidatus Cloacimonadota bacterium]|nr:MAG: hypothetical protein CSB55_05835 [Candidatus Cloacimonadota bacterium]